MSLPWPGSFLPNSNDCCDCAGPVKTVTTSWGLFKPYWAGVDGLSLVKSSMRALDNELSSVRTRSWSA